MIPFFGKNDRAALVDQSSPIKVDYPAVTSAVIINRSF